MKPGYRPGDSNLLGQNNQRGLGSSYYGARPTNAWSGSGPANSNYESGFTPDGKDKAANGQGYWVGNNPGGIYVSYNNSGGLGSRQGAAANTPPTPPTPPSAPPSTPIGMKPMGTPNTGITVDNTDSPDYLKGIASLNPQYDTSGMTPQDWFDLNWMNNG